MDRLSPVGWNGTPHYRRPGVDFLVQEIQRSREFLSSIPMAVPIALEGSKQLGHFVFGQMLTDAVHFVGIPPDLALIA